MNIGLFGGGFKPFTTGHFAKLANAIRDNDRVYLFYGLQEEKAPQHYKIGPKKGQKKVDKRLRSIGDTGRYYTPRMSKDIFDIYKQAIEERLPNVEIESTLGSAPMTRIFEVIEEFRNDPAVEKITIYGDGNTLREYIKNRRYFSDLLDSGKLQLGAIPPESPADYLDEETLSNLVSRSEESARQSLGLYYPDTSEEDVSSMQGVRGTQVRDIASSELGVDAAKRFLPPFLNDAEKERIIQIMLEEEESLAEGYFRSIIRGMIRG